jgi:pimeloyl-ACP methyl ester carboxylesterase
MALQIQGGNPFCNKLVAAATERPPLDGVHVSRHLKCETRRNLRSDVIDGSILENVTAMQVPGVFFTGQFDYTNPTSCTVRLFEKISAPLKKLVWFEHSAHFVFLEEPSRFAAEMRRLCGR